MPGSPQAMTWRKAYDGSRGRRRRPASAAWPVAHGLAGADVKITIIDQRNLHLFQPLLYQVGTASLATSEIAWPVRHLMRKRKEVTTLLRRGDGPRHAEPNSVARRRRHDELRHAGVGHGRQACVFRSRRVEPYAPGLKTLEDATTIRRRILLSFEHGRARNRSQAPRRAADFRHRRRRTHRGGIGRCDRRTCASESAPGISTHRHAQGSRGAD